MYKKIISFMLCLIFLFSFSITSFATSKSLPLPPSSAGNYIVVYQPWNDKYVFYFSSKGFMFNKEKLRVCFIDNVSDTDNFAGNYFSCSSPYSSWVKSSVVWMSNINLFNSTYNQYSVVVYTNSDIYEVDNNYVKTDKIWMSRNTTPWADFDFENVCDTDNDGKPGGSEDDGGLGNWFTSLFSKLGKWFSDLGSSISSDFKNMSASMSKWFDDLGKTVDDSTTKMTNILWWGSVDGEAGYEDLSMGIDFDGMTKQLNSLIDSINSATDVIDSSKQDVVANLNVATSFINSFFGVVPASITALVSIALIFIFVRKVVGR